MVECTLPTMLSHWRSCIVNKMLWSKICLYLVNLRKLSWKSHNLSPKSHQFILNFSFRAALDVRLEISSMNNIGFSMMQFLFRYVLLIAVQSIKWSNIKNCKFRTPTNSTKLEQKYVV